MFPQMFVRPASGSPSSGEAELSLFGVLCTLLVDGVMIMLIIVVVGFVMLNVIKWIACTVAPETYSVEGTPPPSLIQTFGQTFRGLSKLRIW